MSDDKPADNSGVPAAPSPAPPAGGSGAQPVSAPRPPPAMQPFIKSERLED